MAALPRLLARKLYKTGQTRGADDDVVFQNRVLRNSTVLIPFSHWDEAKSPPEGTTAFESGFIALVSPLQYFADNGAALGAAGLRLGENALIFYETRAQWRDFDPDKRGWIPAMRRTGDLGGQYVARVAATTASKDERINRGFTTSGTKGAGIRVYEYAAGTTIADCRTQLEAIFWLCGDAAEVAIAQGMSLDDAAARKQQTLAKAESEGLLDLERLREARIVNGDNRTTCPLCLAEVAAAGFFNRMEQAAGRAVHDLTVTELNLFHIRELRLGLFGHRPYNIGWGHHHCNVVVKDSGIDATLMWMADVVLRNRTAGYLAAANNGRPD